MEGIRIRAGESTLLSPLSHTLSIVFCNICRAYCGIYPDSSHGFHEQIQCIQNVIGAVVTVKPRFTGLLGGKGKRPVNRGAGKSG